MTRRSPLLALATSWAVCLTAALMLLFGPAQAQEQPAAVTRADHARRTAIIAALQQNLPYVPGELLVKFRTGTAPSQQLSALRAIRHSAADSATRWIGETALLSGVATRDLEQAAYVLNAQPEVEYAQPNYILRLHARPNDTLYQAQWNMDQINMPAAWDINTGAASGVIVAVLDSGFTTVNDTVTFRLPVSDTGYTTATVPFLRPPDFDHARITGAAEFTFTGPWETGSGAPILFDAEGHGTHVAGTLAQQTNNAYGYAGVAHGATLMPVKVCSAYMDWVFSWGYDLQMPPTLSGACLSSDVLAGVRYAVDNGAKVLNMSLGAPGEAPAYLEALRYAVSKGAFVAISAGNDAEHGNPVEYPAGYGPAVQGVVSVGATSVGRVRARYSAYGSHIELAAPGGNCTGEDDAIWQVGADDADLTAIPPRFDRYVSQARCGTSMAAPHVAGAAALLYSQGITNPAAIEAALERFAIDLGTAGRDPEFGYGLIDVRAALRGLGLAR
jgi:serine protease